MRPAFALALLLVAGCGLKRMLPSGPVIAPEALAAFEQGRAAGVHYTGPYLVDFPVLPLQVFGVYYDLDVVIVSRHPSWDMHEYARVQTPDGPIWLAKDSRPDMVQTITAELSPEDLRQIVAEVPVPRQAGPVAVDDRSSGRQVDVRLAYTNPDGEPVTVRYRGKLPRRPPKKRNGSTMGHSRQAAAVVLDLERMGTGGRARMTIDGKRVAQARLLGLVRQRFILQQDQGGIAVTSFRIEGGEPGQEGFTLTRPAGAAERDPSSGAPGWPTARVEAWSVEAGVDGQLLARASHWGTTLSYAFVDGGLARATVHQEGRPAPTFELWLDPALPDLSRPFQGTAVSRFRMDVNGQRGHGLGEVRVRWSEDGPDLQIIPLEPWWLADRPMTGSVRFPGDGAAVVQVWRSKAE